MVPEERAKRASRRTDLRELLARPVLDAAPLLLGATLRHGEVAVRLTEVEAYDGGNDPGSHAYSGPTRRNSVMFGPPGHLYVYFTYGMHHCCNVVCGPEGTASAILLRAGVVVGGVETAGSRRTGSSAHDLARGPARLCRALGLDLTHNGTDLTRGPVLLEAPAEPSGPVTTGPRVGVRHAAERRWRFWVEGDPTVSAYRRARPLRSGESAV